MTKLENNTKKVKNMEANVQNKNFVLTRERYFELVKEFKGSLKKKENMPYKDEYGTKYKVITLENFLFYAMLRRKNPQNTVHSIESERYKDAKNRLSRIKTKGWSCENIIKGLRITFPSLTEDEILLIWDDQNHKL